MNGITLYSIPRCPRCAVLKQQLDRADIEYDLITDVEAMISMGITSAPMLRVGGKLLGFSDAFKWVTKHFPTNSKTERGESQWNF